MTPARISLRASALKLSMLSSLGMLTLACGGSAQLDRASGGSNANPDANGGSAGVGDPSGGASGYVSGGASGNVSGGMAGMAGSTASVPGPYDCSSPSYSDADGFAACPDGIPHRRNIVTCQLGSLPPMPSVGDAGAGGDGGSAPANLGPMCETDADCSGIPLGYCRKAGMLPWFCAAGCQQDEDCGLGSACLCDGSPHGGICVRATCSSDAACAPGSYCIHKLDRLNPCDDSPGELACDTGEDLCQTNADCRPDEACQITNSRRECISKATCGRPFLVENAPRVAPITRDHGWQNSAPIAADSSDLSEGERALLAAHWARLGQMEHASIAAFARFNLQLLALGAPAVLVEACIVAMADETAHAKLCFGLASDYAGSALGPGRLDLSQCLEATSLVEVAKLVLREGCLGETMAALEAAECAALATDPAVKAALARIARDEQRHAELAFQFLIWALAEATPNERRELNREAASSLAAARASIRPNAPAAERRALVAHGLVSERALAEVRRQATDHVIQPLLSVIFGESRDARQADCALTAP